MNKKLLVFLLVVPFLYVLNSCTKTELIEPQPDTGTLIDNYPWQYTTLTEAGFKDSLVSAGLNEAQNTGYINGLLIIRNGKIAAERYYRNTTAGDVFNIKSATKSFVSALAGNAILRGYITLDTKLIDALPDYRSVPTDSRVKNITVRHLLTMTSGLKSDDEITPMYKSEIDWVGYLLALRLDHDPGTYSRYSDNGVHLLSAIITKRTNQNSMDFANTTIFTHLNMNIQTWYTDGQGIPFGGAGLYLSLKAMATLGVLYLNNGIYNYRPVVPAEWITASVTDYTGWQQQTMGKMTDVGYGYLWWLGKIAGHKVYAAMGYGGQLVVCVPDFNMVVASTAPADQGGEQAQIQKLKVISLIADYFIPAVK